MAAPADAINGQVSLPLEHWDKTQSELRELRSQMREFPDLQAKLAEVPALEEEIARLRRARPPVLGGVAAANYTATVKPYGLDVAVVMRIIALGTGQVTVPLFDRRAAIMSATLPAGVELVYENNRPACRVNAPGTYRFSLTLSVAAQNNKTAFGIPQAGVNTIKVILPGTTASVQISPSAGLARQTQLGQTIVEAALAPMANEIALEWSPLGGALTEVRRSDRIYLNTFTGILIEPGTITGRTQLNYDIRGGATSEFTLAIPAGIGIVEVQGTELATWNVIKTNDEERLVFQTQTPVSGLAGYTVVWAAPLLPEARGVRLPSLRGVDITRESGMVGVSAGEAMELSGCEVEGMQLLDPRYAASEVVALSGKPFVYYGRYSGEAWTLNLALNQLEAVTVVPARFEEVIGTTVVLPTGKIVNHISARLRNFTLDFIDIQLSPEGLILEAKLDNQPVRPVKGAESGIIRLPLIRTEPMETGGTISSLELVYEVKPVQGLAALGNQIVQPPSFSAAVTKMLWRINLPETVDLLWVRPDTWREFSNSEWDDEFRQAFSAVRKPNQTISFPRNAMNGPRRNFKILALVPGESAATVSFAYADRNFGKSVGIVILVASLLVVYAVLRRLDFSYRLRVVFVVTVTAAICLELLVCGGVRRLVQGLLLGVVLAIIGAFVMRDEGKIVR